MKYSKNNCPWITNTELYDENLEKTKLQKLLGCNCQFNENCPGYCTLPTNHTLEIPSRTFMDNNKL